MTFLLFCSTIHTVLRLITISSHIHFCLKCDADKLQNHLKEADASSKSTCSHFKHTHINKLPLNHSLCLSVSRTQTRTHHTHIFFALWHAVKASNTKAPLMYWKKSGKQICITTPHYLLTPRNDLFYAHLALKFASRLSVMIELR